MIENVTADSHNVSRQRSAGPRCPEGYKAYFRGPFVWPWRPPLVSAVPSVIFRAGFRGSAALKSGGDLGLGDTVTWRK